MPDPTRTNFGSGNSAVASVTASFGFTATAGRLLVLGLFADNTSTTPSGWTAISGPQNTFGSQLYFFYKVAAGGETSAAYTLSSAEVSIWAVAEFDNVMTSSPLDVSSGQATETAGGTYTTPTLTPTSGRRFSIALVTGWRNTTDLPTMGSWTNSYTEQVEVGINPSGSRALAMATLAMDGTGAATTSTGVTYGAGSVTAQARSAIIAAFKVDTGGTTPRRMSLLGIG